MNGSTQRDSVGYLLAIRGRSRSSAVALISVALALLCIIVASAQADDEGNTAERLSPSAIEESGSSSINLPEELVNSKEAEKLPHRDLDRNEASDLIEGVFGGLLEGAAGPFGDLRVEEFLSDTTAIVAGEQGAKPLLMESTLPLRTEDEAGQDRVVNLDLEHDEGELRAANPLAEVGIPEELGEGIDLASGTLDIDTDAAAEERSPSILAGNVALYPNVAKDTDFAVATTPTGVETFTQLRSSDAPQEQTFNLNLESGITLEEDSDGGAVAMSGGEEVLRVLAPTSLDASGESVPTSLEISGDSLTLRAHTNENTAFPVLLDPVISTWHWSNWGNEGLDEGNTIANTPYWDSWRNTSAYGANSQVAWREPQSPLFYLDPGLAVTSGWNAPVAYGAQALWSYWVPRYWTDYEKFGLRPTSFIEDMKLWNVSFYTPTAQVSPFLIAGIYNEEGKAASLYTRKGNEGSIGSQYWNFVYDFPNPTSSQAVKRGAFGLMSNEAEANSPRLAYAGYASVTLNDTTKPTIGSFVGPEKWQNATAAEGLSIDASDSGLGMRYLRYEGEKAEETYTVPLYCDGTWNNPCPRTWNTSTWKGYPAASLSTGIHLYTVTALDVLGNESAEHPKVPVKIDHTAPSLTLSGTMTQQASLGYKRPQYVLHLEGVDGVSGSPQAGIAGSEVTVDGKVMDSTKAGCATQNCSLSRDWTLKSEAYSAGEHKVVASVTDGAGNTTTKSLTIKIEKDTTAPILETGGTLVTAPQGWVEQVSRSAWAYAEDGKGYGVTSLSFSVDGKVVKSQTQACSSGGCEAEITSALNMAGYAAGAHAAEIIAKDGAGNVSKKAWTINVNPSGTVPSVEAAKTLEASDVTSESLTIAPTSEVVEPTEVEEGNDPSLVVEGSSLKSSGTAVKSSLTIDAGSGYTVDGGKESFHIEPTQSSVSETNIEVKNGVAGVAANTTGGVDTVVRPLYDGIQAFQDIREAAAPEAYSWKVQLHSGQSLKAIDETHVGVYYAELELLAMTITAETSHDATGKVVPTSLSVSGSNVLTLTVHHRNGGFVYPVVAGSVFQPGYETIIVEGPPTKQQEEQQQAEESMAGMTPVLEFGPPIPSGTGAGNEATISSGSPTFHRTFQGQGCAPAGCFLWNELMKGYFWYNGYEAWWKKEQPHPKCTPGGAPWYSFTMNYCDFIGPNHQKYGAGYHITAQMLFDVHTGLWTSGGKHVTVRMFGDGYIGVHDTDEICNPSRPGC